MGSETFLPVYLVAAGSAGLVCGLLPLGIGLWKQRPGLGVLGCLLCLVSGVLLGLILAAPVAAVLAVGIWRAPKWDRERDLYGKEYQARRLPTYCVILFSLGLATAVTAWIALLATMPQWLEKVQSSPSDHDSTVQALKLLSAVGWVFVFLGVAANSLLLLRYHLGVWVGWAYVLCSVVFLVVLHDPLAFPEAATDASSSMGEGSNLLLLWGYYLGFSVLYIGALIRFHLWALPKEPLPPATDRWGGD